MSTEITTDVVVIGAGPCGLFAAFELGLLDVKCHFIDILDRPGGQCAVLYPEKPIYDIPGFPVVTGQQLTDNLMAQIAPFSPEFHFSRMVNTLDKLPDGTFRLTTDADETFYCKVVVIAAGGGSFQPKRPPVEGIEQYENKSVFYAVRKMDDFRDQDVVIVGGGDSALDWTLNLQPIVRTLTLVHRRDAFRAHARTVEAVRASRVEIVTKAEVSAIHGNGTVESVEITVDGEPTSRPAQAIVAALGFVADLGPIQQWGLEVAKRHVVVDSSMRTNLARVFAAGDITEYPGKVRLIAVGFGEAATAVNNAAVVIDPSAHVCPGHSSEGS